MGRGGGEVRSRGERKGEEKQPLTSRVPLLAMSNTMF